MLASGVQQSDPPFGTVSPRGSSRSADRAPCAAWQLISRLGGVLCSVASVFPAPYNPVDCSPPGSSDHGVFLARILEWVVTPSSMGIFPTQGSNSHFLRLLHRRQIPSIVCTPEAQPPHPSHALFPACCPYICLYLCMWAYLKQRYCLSAQRPPYLLKSKCVAECLCFHAVL